MKITENECLECEKCVGSFCKYIKVTRYYCDKCGSEEQLYYFDNKQLCIDCIIKSLEKVNWKGNLLWN